MNETKHTSDQFIKNILEAISVTTQSIPSINPSPVTAEQGIIPQCRVVISSKSKNFRISSEFNEP